MRKLTQEQAIKNCIAVHGSLYDYSKFTYVRGIDPVTVICPEHGEFDISYQSHVNAKARCQQCARKSNGLMCRKPRELFIEEAKKAHGDRYEYPDVYDGAHTLISIICKKHGPFLLKPYVHVKGQGCPDCGIEEGKAGYPYTIESFIEKAKGVHGEKYGYNLSKLTKSSDEVTIICSTHGPFMQIASQHVWGYGCYRCARASSGAERELGERIRFLGLEIIVNEKHGLGFELDIFIPRLNIAIEYNGLIWHSEWKKNKKDAEVYHLRKTEACEARGIRLIHVWEDDWIFRNETCWTWLKAQLGFHDQKLSARNCTVQACAWSEIEDFVNVIHIQGSSAKCKFNYKLVDKTGSLVGVMVFGTQPGQETGSIVLKRFCTKGHVRGGFSKLLTAFLRDQGDQYSKIVSFSDRSWSRGLVYEANGFKKIGITKPDYHWTKNRQRIHRWHFQADVIHKLIPSRNPGLTEDENCYNNGYLKIWNCGLIKWEFTIPK